jgi:hypothetical protein
MNEKPEALRLADALKERHGANSFEDDAATELRRQHAEIERLKAERDEAVKAEREACAKVCDEVECGSSMMIEERQTANECARKIRARGEVPR